MQQDITIDLKGKEFPLKTDLINFVSTELERQTNEINLKNKKINLKEYIRKSKVVYEIINTEHERRTM